MFFKCALCDDPEDGGVKKVIRWIAERSAVKICFHCFKLKIISRVINSLNNNAK